MNDTMTDPLAECRDAAGNLDLEKVKAWEEGLKAEAAAAADQVTILRENFLSLHVCARCDLQPAQVTELVERIHPAGTSGGWSVEMSVPPVTCQKDAGRLHWILTC